jgi:hypothetical protein
MIESVVFPNIGFLKIQLTEDQVVPIKQEIDKIKKNFILATEANAYLVGHIEKEYNLNTCKDYFNFLLKDLVKIYEDTFGYIARQSYLSKDAPLAVDDVWVNFQSKHEFNPAHDHSGVLSFVLWIQIPYSIKEEIMYSPGKKSKAPLSGHFGFYYTNSLGQISYYDIPADKSMENCMLIFPSRLNHTVHPFYSSDEYRISVSGNIVFQI